VLRHPRNLSGVWRGSSCSSSFVEFACPPGQRLDETDHDIPRERDVCCSWATCVFGTSCERERDDRDEPGARRFVPVALLFASETERSYSSCRFVTSVTSSSSS
jgi:hypothetical protein